MKVYVVVPMYNEEAGAQRCVREISKVLSTLPHKTTLLVVDDGSTDRTPAILGELKASCSLLSVRRHAQNGGYGRAMQTAYQEAATSGADYVLVMDSDLTNDPRYIALFIEKMIAGYDIIKASRYVEGGRVEGVPFGRVIVSRIGNWLVRRMIGLPLLDYTNGFRALRMHVVRQMQLTETGFAIILEEMYFAKFTATSFCEIPYILTSRSKGQAKSHFRYRPQVFVAYVKHPLRAFFRVRPRVQTVENDECAML